ILFGLTAVPFTFSIPILTATKSDLLIVDNNANNAADPGDTIRYTNIFTNSGSTAATNVNFADTIDANTTLVAGSIKTTPIARHDSYAAIGNVGITVLPGSGVLVNDNDPDGGSVSVIAAAGGTANGGAFAIGSDGAFSYLPPAGFEGTDSFGYTIQDSDGNQDPATVFITVSDVIWFIDNSAAAGGNGQLTNPFNSLAAYNTNAADDPGDIIFMY
ncbi:MAG: cadherin-like domain-containing protein, partial [Gammaproteobacteria bacterium]|nr:cadherin-like domain-containing protein [Gammaproteobacteria bacterium]